MTRMPISLSYSILFATGIILTLVTSVHADPCKDCQYNIILQKEPVITNLTDDGLYTVKIPIEISPIAGFNYHSLECCPSLMITPRQQDQCPQVQEPEEEFLLCEVNNNRLEDPIFGSHEPEIDFKLADPKLFPVVDCCQTWYTYIAENKFFLLCSPSCPGINEGLCCGNTAPIGSFKVPIPFKLTVDRFGQARRDDPQRTQEAWANQLLGHDLKSPVQNNRLQTLANVGCTITSAAMILRSYGFDTLWLDEADYWPGYSPFDRGGMEVLQIQDNTQFPGAKIYEVKLNPGSLNEWASAPDQGRIVPWEERDDLWPLATNVDLQKIGTQDYGWRHVKGKGIIRFRGFTDNHSLKWCEIGKAVKNPFAPGSPWIGFGDNKPANKKNEKELRAALCDKRPVALRVVQSGLTNSNCPGGFVPTNPQGQPIWSACPTDKVHNRHSVVAYGSSGTSFLIRDPSNKSYQNLDEPHFALLDSKWDYHRESFPRSGAHKPSISFYVFSPANIFVSDSAGQMTGMDIAQIPGSYYDFEPTIEDQFSGEIGVDGYKAVIIESPQDNEYTVALVGSGVGNFTLQVEAVNNVEMWTTSSIAGSVIPGQILKYRVSLNPLVGPIITKVNRFVRGDGDSNGSIDISDVIFGLRFLFLKGETPACLDALDVNDDGQLDISDPVRILIGLFVGGKQIPPPNACGANDTSSKLGCDSFPPCESLGTTLLVVEDRLGNNNPNSPVAESFQFVDEITAAISCYGNEFLDDDFESRITIASPFVAPEGKLHTVEVAVLFRAQNTNPTSALTIDEIKALSYSLRIWGPTHPFPDYPTFPEAQWRFRKPSNFDPLSSQYYLNPISNVTRADGAVFDIYHLVFNVQDGIPSVQDYSLEDGSTYYVTVQSNDQNHHMRLVIPENQPVGPVPEEEDWFESYSAVTGDIVGPGRFQSDFGNSHSQLAYRITVEPR